MALLPSFVFSQSDLSLDSVFHRMGVGEFYEDGLEYYKIANYHSQPVQFSAWISNVGTTSLTDCQVFVEVLLEGTSVFVDESIPVDLNVGQSDSVAVELPYLFSFFGDYEVNYWVECTEADDNVLNDTTAISIVVDEESGIYTPPWFSRASSTQYGAIGSNPFLPGEWYEVGYTIELFDDLCLEAMKVFINNDPLAVGHEIYGAIYKLDSTGVFSPWSFSDMTDESVITSGDLGTYLPMYFDDEASACAGTILLVVVGNYGGPVLNLFGASQETMDNTVLHMNMIDTAFVPMENARMPMIDLRGDGCNCELGLVEEKHNDLKMLNHPNPFNSTTTISFQLPNPETVNLVVTDIHGKEIYSEDLGIMSAGENEYQLFTEDWPEGVYLYTISAGGIQETKRMILIR